MNDSANELIMEEVIAEQKNENNSNDGVDLLVPDANVHIVSAENREDETKKAKKIKESKKKFHHLLGRKEQTHMKGQSTD